MSKNVFMERLARGEPLVGLNNNYPASGIIEGMCGGWDFVWIDGQHGQHSYDTVLHALQAARAMGIFTLLRVVGHDPANLGAYADLAPSAIMIPMVNTAAQAELIVKALNFAPKGFRSYGGRRVIDLYGRDFYTETRVGVVAQVETLESLSNVEAIAATEGVDGLFFGPDDMKLQMGLPVNTVVQENQALCDAMERVAKACKSAGKFAGCVSGAGKAAAQAHEMGYRLFAGGSDISLLRTMAADKLKELRSATGSSGPVVVEKKSSGMY